MARWRLVAPHYLNVPGTEWEYKENDRLTGRPKRKTFPVPLLLDPTQPSDWNHKNGDEGEIIVCHEGKGQDKDITFVGEPTADMIPLDDEAKEITAKLEKKWKHPIETLPSTYGEMVLDNLQKEVAKVQAAQTAQPQAQQIEGVQELLAAMAGMMKQNQELINALAVRAVPAPTEPIARRA